MDPAKIGITSSNSQYDTFGKFDHQVVNASVTNQDNSAG